MVSGNPERADDSLAERIAAAVQVAIAPLIAVVSANAVAIARLASNATAPAPSSTLTWAELWPMYWDAVVNNLDSWKGVRSVGKHIVRLLGSKPVMETTVQLVRWYRATRKAEPIIGGRGKGKLPKPKTIDNEIIILRRVTKWAGQQRPALLPSDPLGSAQQSELLENAPNIRLNVVDDDPDAPLSLAQFIRHGDEFDRAMVLVAHSSGMRRREIALFDTTWVDRRPGRDGKPLRLVMIPPGISKGRRGHKKGRITIVSEDALAAIDEYRRTLPLLNQRRGGPVFVNADTGRGYHPDTLTARFKALQERAGATGPSGPVWLHDLRRSFITLARRRGEDAVNVMQLAGHTTLQSQERYHVRSLREAISIRDRIEAARAAELEALANERRGPQRVGVDKSDREENKRQLRFVY